MLAYSMASLRVVAVATVAASDAVAVDEPTRAQAAAIIDEVRAGGEAGLIAVAVCMLNAVSRVRCYAVWWLYAPSGRKLRRRVLGS